MLLAHQKRALDIAQHHSRWAFYHDTGTGKTLIGLSIIKQRGVPTIIVAPKFLLKDAWLGDMRKFYPELLSSAVVWHDIHNRRGEAINLQKYPVLLINYESLTYHPEVLSMGYKMLLLDESQKIKNHKAKITKLLMKHKEEFDYVYLFSGTPAPNSELEYYPQLYLLGATSDRFWRFRNRYFYPVDRNGWKWKLRSSHKEEFYSLLSSCSDVVKKEDVLDLKGQFTHIVEYEPDKNILKHYSQMYKHFITEVENNEITATTAATKIMKLRQILSGFIYNNDQAHFISDRKKKTLLDLLEVIGNQQTIIWIQFEEEAIQLADLPNSCIITGKTPTKLRHEYIEQFRKGSIQYLIAHPKTIGHGTTLTNCNIAIYYSLSYSWEEFKQSQDRIYRKGQDKAVHYYIMLTSSLIDRVIYKALQNKASVSDYILEYIKASKLF